ncbi:MAG TPA: DnaA/Hda family protein [Pirellulales bacterium]|nr:DnaA/Hda family protein [Pirellulales bacterium]
MEHEVFAISFPAGTGRSMAQNVSKQAPPNNPEFIVGPENHLAASVVGWLCKRERHYSPLVLCGPSGAGKSHLAHSLVQSRNDAVYTRGADFARELATAVEKDAASDFRNRFRAAGMLVLDDFPQMLGRPAALQEFQHTLDALEAREASVIITARRTPQEMADLPPPLRSRLSSGLVVKISPPGIAARQRILERFAVARGIALSPEAAKLLAEQFNVTATELRGHLAKIEMEARSKRVTNKGGVVNADSSDRDRLNDPLTIESPDIRRYLSHHRLLLRPSLEQVTTAVAKFYGLKPAAMSSPSRRRQVVFARGMAIYLGRTLCGASLKTLGKHFGGRDHTTVLHSFRQLQSRLSSDSELNNAVDHLQQVLTKRAS